MRAGELPRSASSHFDNHKLSRNNFEDKIIFPTGSTGLYLEDGGYNSQGSVLQMLSQTNQTNKTEKIMRKRNHLIFFPQTARMILLRIKMSMTKYG